MNPLQSVALSVVRHVLTAVAGVLVAKGVLDPTGQEAWIGAAMGVLAVGWSAAEKYGLGALLTIYQGAGAYARPLALAGAVAASGAVGYGGATMGAPARPAHAWSHLAALDVRDIEYAAALAEQSAKNGGSQAAKDRLDCYRELAGVVTTLQGVRASTGTKSTFKPVLTQLEQDATLTDHAASGSDLISACAPVAEAHGMRVGRWLETIGTKARQ